MKNTTKCLGLFLLLLVTASQGFGQSLTNDLRDAYIKLNSPVMANKVVAAEQFNNLADQNPKDWAANYYAAYANVTLSMALDDAKRQDAYLDKADNYLKIATDLHHLPDESAVLTAYVNFARYLVDPANRWKKYLDAVNMDPNAAKYANKDNPRVYYLEGIPVFFFNKPKLYCGGKNKAKPYFTSWPGSRKNIGNTLPGKAGFQVHDGF